MPQVTELSTTWNLPNFAGELFTADGEMTPFLTMIGGLTGGMQTNNFEFPTGVLYDYPKAAQPEISEQGSAKAPQATAISRMQEKNVVQIFHETLDMTYVKMSNSGRMSGINSALDAANPPDDHAWQIQHKLIKIARDVEYTFLQGKYALATKADEPNKTRGMIELCSTGNTVAAAAAPLSKDMINSLLLLMANNGAYFNNMVLFCSAEQKQRISDVYNLQNGFQLPANRNVGGVNITEIETDFCRLGIVWDRFMPNDTILIADMAHIVPVFQVVPNKGVLFVEALAKTGASEREQIFGQIGLAHGAKFLHGTITGLKVGA